MAASYYYLDKEQLYKLLAGLEEIYRRLDNNTFARIDVDELIAGSITVEDTVTVGRNPQEDMEVATKLYVDDLVGHSGSATNVEYNTVAGWNAQAQLVSVKGTVYVYTDYKTIHDVQGNEINVPAIKLGDGNAFLIDIPFVVGNDTDFLDHINNQMIHITQAEREFWNNKVRSIMSQAYGERLILTTN